METMTDFEKRIKAMRLEITAQNKTIDELATSFNHNKQQLVQHDQIACLQTLRARILKEVENTRRMESAAQRGSYKGNILCGLVAFAANGLFTTMNNREDAVLVGLKAANSVMSKKSPFGSVFVAIGKEGLPEDVEVAPISRLARESNKSESDIKAKLQEKGYLVMTPEAFIQILDKVEIRIHGGTISLPITIDKLKLVTRAMEPLRLVSFSSSAKGSKKISVTKSCTDKRTMR